MSTEGPQTQLSQQSSPALWGQLVARTFELDSVVEGHSQVSPASSRAVFLADMAEEHSSEASLAPGKRLEPVHLHGVHDTSVHLCLPAKRGAELTELGWGSSGSPAAARSKNADAVTWVAGVLASDVRGPQPWPIFVERV